MIDENALQYNNLQRSLCDTCTYSVPDESFKKLHDSLRFAKCRRYSKDGKRYASTAFIFDCNKGEGYEPDCLQFVNIPHNVIVLPETHYINLSDLVTKRDSIIVAVGVFLFSLFILTYRLFA